MNKTKILIITYIIGVIITFGAAYHHNPKNSAELNWNIAYWGALGWPFYWSYRIFEPKTHE